MRVFAVAVNAVLATDVPLDCFPFPRSVGRPRYVRPTRSGRQVMAIWRYDKRAVNGAPFVYFSTHLM